MARGRKKGTVTVVQVVRFMTVKGVKTEKIIQEYPHKKAPESFDLKEGKYAVRFITRRAEVPAAVEVEG